MPSPLHFSETASRKKFFRCAIASSENRPARRAASRVWASRRRNRVRVICYADHLGTPRAITTSDATNTKVWEWSNSDPFGNNLPNEDPTATGSSFKYNLRFPGQYFDQETGTHYNYFRDYDPGTGRYIESDPVGLGAGLSIYAYVGGNPLIGIDPLGLMITGTWIKPPRFNIQNYGIDRVEGVAPSWSWWGYVKFVRLSGHAEGFVNVDVKCHDDCKDWEIHNNISVEVNGYLDVGPNVYAIAGGLASRNPYVGIGLNVVLAGGSLLQAEHHFLNLVNQKAESIISALSAKGPTTVCLGSTLK